MYGTLYSVYKERNEFEEALEALEKFVEFNDSLTNNDQKLETAKKEIEFEARQKEILAQAEIDRQKLEKSLFISGGVVLIVFLLIGFTAYRQKAREKAKTKEADFKLKLTESKLVALRAQLNPHFTFNALNAIDQFMITHGVEKASDYLLKFASLMRNILDNSQEDWIPISEEMKQMGLYLEIAGLRLQESIKLAIDIDEGIDPENTLVPSWLIQPIIENSVEHGIMKKNSQGTITIRIFPESSKQLTFIIEDDGEGLYGNGKSENGRPNGMNIVKERVRYLNELTNSNTYFEVKDIGHGVRVTIKIPFKTKFE